MLNVRLFSAEDKDCYLKFSKDFYLSGAALEPIPEENMCCTFETLLTGTPHADGFMILSDDIPAGYCLVSFWWSTEMGGLLALIDELYISPEFRGKQLGSAFLQYIEAYYKGRIVGLRLEVCFSNQGAIRLYEKQGYHFLEYRQMIKRLV